MTKRRMSKREAVLLAAEIAESQTPAPERMKALLFIERNSQQSWNRKRRRKEEQTVGDMVKTIELNERRKLLDALEEERALTQDNGGKLQ